MKKTDFRKIVEDNQTKSENEIAGILLSEGATLGLINQLLNKILIELGVKEDSRKVLKAVRKEVESSNKTIETHRDMRIWAEVLAEKHNADTEAVMSVIRKHLKVHDIEAPSKINLGIIKATIVSYFANTDTPTMDELVETLQAEAELEEAEALRHARQNYSFALLLRRGLSLEDVN